MINGVIYAKSEQQFQDRLSAEVEFCQTETFLSYLVSFITYK